MEKKIIETGKTLEEQEKSMQEAFLKLSDEERFILACEVSEIMIRIQYENGVWKEPEHFVLRK